MMIKALFHVLSRFLKNNINVSASVLKTGFSGMLYYVYYHIIIKSSRERVYILTILGGGFALSFSDK
jgi:hypothetical protein